MKNVVKVVHRHVTENLNVIASLKDVAKTVSKYEERGYDVILIELIQGKLLEYNKVCIVLSKEVK